MKILTVSQASKYCNIDSETIISWIKEGHIAAETTVGAHRRIKKEDLDRFLQDRNMTASVSEADEARKKILVVDDDKIVVETIVQCLEEDEHGYELISAADGFEAGAQVMHFKPDLLLLDIMMPDINGYEVCKKLKSDSATNHIKIIVLSAYLDDDNYKQMKEHGADACFSKPLPLSDLKVEVAKLLFDEIDR